MKRHVFIIADIGREKDGTLHVGDEAMFFSNLDRYQRMGVHVAASSRSFSHQEEGFDEYLDIYISGYLMYCWLFFLALLRKYTRVDLFPQRFKPTIEALVSASLLHISGGGNINSIWPGHLYYRALMILIASLHNVPIIMTGQTIGPITRPLHRMVFARALRRVVHIGVRDEYDSVRELNSLHVPTAKIAITPDDAVFMPSVIANDVCVRNGGTIRVGLSLHEWSVDENALCEQIRILAMKYPTMLFVLIPHTFSPSGKGDVDFMQRMMMKIDPSSSKTVTPSYLEKQSSVRTKVSMIVRESAQVDLMIATRYHGVIFALSSGAPTVACFGDEYYRIKQEGVLNMFLGDTRYAYDLYRQETGDLVICVEQALLDRKEIMSRVQQKMLSWEPYRDEYYCNLYYIYASCS